MPIVLKTGETEETLNQAKAFWTRPKSELKDEDYQAFYKHIYPRFRGRAGLGAQQGRRQYRIYLAAVPAEACAVRFVRARAEGRHAAIRQARLHHGQGGRVAAAVPALHARTGRYRRSAAERVARTAAEQSHGREDQVRAGQAHRSDLLEDLAANKPEEYAEFWKTFGVVLKEGIIEDAGQKARIAKLLRFHSTAVRRRCCRGHARAITYRA